MDALPPRVAPFRGPRPDIIYTDVIDCGHLGVAGYSGDLVSFYQRHVPLLIGNRPEAAIFTTEIAITLFSLPVVASPRAIVFTDN